MLVRPHLAGHERQLPTSFVFGRRSRARDAAGQPCVMAQALALSQQIPQLAVGFGPLKAHSFPSSLSLQEFSPSDYRSNYAPSRTPTPPGGYSPHSPIDRDVPMSPRRRYRGVPAPQSNAHFTTRCSPFAMLTAQEITWITRRRKVAKPRNLFFSSSLSKQHRL